jgi:hypothetical protein
MRAKEHERRARDSGRQAENIRDRIERLRAGGFKVEDPGRRA